MLSLPMFAIMPRSVQRGFVGLNRSSTESYGGGGGGGVSSSTIRPYTILALNLVSQLVCVAGVNQLSSVSHLLFYFWLARPFLLLVSINNRTTDLPLHFPIRQLVYSLLFICLFFFSLLVESVRGVNSSRAHGAQGD
jgi:hypothetical protein